MVQDKITVGEGLKVTLAEYVKPKHPCPKCGSEMKPHHAKGEWICSARKCRHIVRG